MDFTLRIQRQLSPHDKPSMQDFVYSGDGRDSVAAALRALNERSSLLDATGAEAAPIGWDCGCCAGKCGACAMRINGKPALACKTFLGAQGGVILLQPLSKFPLVRDLIVDRNVLFEQLKTLQLWLDERGQEDERTRELRYQSARCLMCGCCLEVCPNFAADGNFAGAAAAVSAFKFFALEAEAAHARDEKKAYVRAFYNGCGTSLACESVCPAGIPVNELISRSNAAAVWRRLRVRREEERA